MRHVLNIPLAVGLTLLGVACSGGSTDQTSSVRIRCLGGQAFCIISCDLGCSQTGCAVSEIAENQRLRFRFSDRVDPASVNGASISIRTATGVAPDGDYLVVDSEVTFVPRVRTVNGVSTFGFLRNESYIVSLAGGGSASQGVRNLAGDTLSQEFTCTVRATLGIQDEDQQPPTAILLSPTSTTAAPADPVIVVQFSELIDTTALQSPLSDASPIRIVRRDTLANGECDRDAEGLSLEGLPSLSTALVNGREVTQVTWQSPVQLPGRSCITVYVTSDLRDLSGRAAVPTSFEFVTEAGVSSPIDLIETFASPANQEELVSGGIWGPGPGGAVAGARPGLIGGDGRHGSFNITFGNSVGGGEYQWNAGNLNIPASNTPAGIQYTVTDGRFYFTDFVLPEGQTLTFVGSVVPQIYVRGRCEIFGTIKLNAPDMPFFVSTVGLGIGQRSSTFNSRGSTATTTPFVTGQPGGLGGPGGGAGGKGGDECQSTGPQPAYNGQNGQDVRVPGGHAFLASTVGTGGRGSPLQPTTGLSTQPNPPNPLISGVYRSYFSLGGSGGGFSGPGGQSSANPLLNSWPNTAQPGGLGFALVPLPANPPLGYQSLDHFVVGGSGGGGGGSHTFGTLNTSGDHYLAGHGGTGGGGAMAVRAGGDLVVGPAAQLQSKGGLGVLINGDNPGTPTQDQTFGISSPGGGGSGGSFLLQSGRNLSVSGLIDTSGSLGSRTGLVNLTFLNITTQAGAGAPGFYRLEAAGQVSWAGSASCVPPFVQADNTGVLTDRDGLSGDQSKWRGTGLIFPPTWLRYELDVDPLGDGNIVTYTDSGDPGTQKANDPNGPVVILFQGARLNQAGTTPIEGTIKPWREGIGNGAGPGIQQDAVTGFRFLMIYNTAAFPNQVVRALRVFART